MDKWITVAAMFPVKLERGVQVTLAAQCVLRSVPTRRLVGVCTKCLGIDSLTNRHESTWCGSTSALVGGGQ